MKKLSSTLFCVLVIVACGIVLVQCETKTATGSNSHAKSDKQDSSDATIIIRNSQDISSLVKEETYTNLFMYANRHTAEDGDGDGEAMSDEDDDEEEIVETSKPTDSSKSQEPSPAPTTPGSSTSPSATTTDKSSTSTSPQTPPSTTDNPTPSKDNIIKAATDAIKTHLTSVLSESGLTLTGTPKVQIKLAKNPNQNRSPIMVKKLEQAKALLDTHQTLNPDSITKAIEIYNQVSKEYPEDSVALYNLGFISKTSDYGRFNFSLSKHYFLQSAYKGNPSAQFEVGFLFGNGFMTKNDLEEVKDYLDKRQVPYLLNMTQFDPQSLAMTNFFFSAMAGHLRSQLALGYRHLFGVGCPKSCSTAAYYYKIAADKVAMDLVNSSPFVEHVRLSDDTAIQTKQAQQDIMEYHQYTADKGVSTSQLLLGFANMYGIRGVEQNPEAARRYLDRAAEAGEAEAYGVLGNMFSKGIGVTPDNSTALEYYQKGARVGDSTSQNGLGLMYLHGSGGVKKDLKLALQYLNASASQGNPDGQYNLGLLYMTGIAGVPQSYKTAFSYMSLAAQQGHVLAHYQLGVMHLRGLGVEPNCNVAVKYLKIAVERGEWAEVLEDAFDAYTTGDYAKALILYEQAAEQGLELGQSNAAFLYETSLGVRELMEDRIMELAHKTNEDPQNVLNILRHHKAIKLHKLAADQGNVDAYVKIGDYFYYGLGTMVSFDRSVQQYRKAADLRNAQAMFNLGYMHEHGKGLAQDFYLAKRYYDMAADTDSAAYAPVILALVKLYAHWGITLVRNMILGSKSSAASSPSSSENVSGVIKDWLYNYEDIILALLFGMLGLLFLFRQIFAVRQRVQHQRQQREQQQQPVPNANEQANQEQPLQIHEHHEHQE